MPDEQIAFEACEMKPVRKKAAAKSAPAADAGPRKWEDVVPQIKALRDEGITVPEIADRLDVSYVLVNQVITQSYKMTVDTIAMFDRQEQVRLEGLVG
jgi:hypothetical protein